jgi:hypothetical protein
MTRIRITLVACVMATCVLVPALSRAQIPGVGSLPTSLDKGALLEQAKKLVADLTSMKQNPNLAEADKGKVDALLPKATSVNNELAKPQVEPSRLTQLAGQLGDLQKQVGALKGSIK